MRTYNTIAITKRSIAKIFYEKQNVQQNETIYLVHFITTLNSGQVGTQYPICIGQRIGGRSRHIDVLTLFEDVLDALDDNLPLFRFDRSQRQRAKYRSSHDQCGYRYHKIDDHSALDRHPAEFESLIAGTGDGE